MLTQTTLSMDIFQMPLLQKAIKFGTVGLSGMCIDFFITWLCKEKIRLNKYIANSAGFFIAVLNNFFLNYVWTFKGANSSIPNALGLFVLFALIGLVLNNFLVYLFTDVGSLNFYIAKALAIMGVFFWNFTANYIFNFHS